ncbi:hypothetical protein tb265_06430 [Gemmatimonadetes bacterium T265]|nr:hypothetical protein tb265_06430 [Gemmatimonadetes bacterium T265]
MPLLNRLRQTQAANKDAEADGLIRQTVQAQPDAPYILAQTVLMQDYALHAAQDRIHALEQQLAQTQQQGQHASGGGGFLGSLFGGGRSAPSTPQPPPGSGAPYGGGYAQPSYGSQIASAVQSGAGQPSFLRSAAQTAAGIAGGALLFQGVENLFGGHGGGGLLGGGGSGFLGGGGSGLLGDAVSGGTGYGDGGQGLASVDNFADNAGRSDDDPPTAYDPGGVSGGDTGGYADDTAYQPGDYPADDSDQSGFADTGDDGGGGDFGGGDDSFNS